MIPGMRTISVMQPVSDTPQVAGALAPRPRDLRGMAVGFVDEAGANGDVMMDALQDELVRRAGIGTIVRTRLGTSSLHITSVESGETRVVDTPGPAVDELSRWCAAAVTGVGY
jgi:hypothetical protein